MFLILYICTFYRIFYDLNGRYHWLRNIGQFIIFNVLSDKVIVLTACLPFSRKV